MCVVDDLTRFVHVGEELKGIELHTGVVAHGLMCLSLHDKQSALQDAAKGCKKDVNSARGGALA